MVRAGSGCHPSARFSSQRMHDPGVESEPLANYGSNGALGYRLMKRMRNAPVGHAHLHMLKI